jgi:hypothetical protein
MHNKERALGLAAVVVVVGSLIALRFSRRKKKMVWNACPSPPASTFPPPPKLASYRKMSFEETDDSGTTKFKLFCRAYSEAPIRLASTGIGSAKPETVRRRSQIAMEENRA